MFEPISNNLESGSWCMPAFASYWCSNLTLSVDWFVRKSPQLSIVDFAYPYCISAYGLLLTTCTASDLFKILQSHPESNFFDFDGRFERFNFLEIFVYPSDHVVIATTVVGLVESGQLLKETELFGWTFSSTALTESSFCFGLFVYLLFYILLRNGVPEHNCCHFYL